MPTRKQRRRLQKERRHQYETVWVDSEGNELDEPPEELVARPEKLEKRDSAKPKAKAAQKRGGRQVRVPPPPSWQHRLSLYERDVSYDGMCHARRGRGRGLSRPVAWFSAAESLSLLRES